MMASCKHRITGASHDIIYMFSQKNYGSDGKCYTLYDAFRNIMGRIRAGFPEGTSFAIPYGIGCGNAGGDWNIIYSIIQKYLGDKFNVYLYKLNSTDKPWFGFTEGCDPSVSFNWVNNLSPYGNIIISKNLTDDLIKQLVIHKDKVIFHHTVTGLGGFPVEKNIPPKEWSRKQFDKLISAGFPLNQCVLRVDPIIPTDKGMETALSVLDLYKDTGIKRVRFSFLDMYPHVKERFIQQGIRLPYDTFNAPREMMLSGILKLTKKAEECGYYLEACAESCLFKKGCLSQTDYDILHIPYEDSGSNHQRQTCICSGAKREILPRKNNKCTLGCTYCYWR